MARIPEIEIERLKKEVSLVRLVEASGIELEKARQRLCICCPFHGDGTPSFIITQVKTCTTALAAMWPVDRLTGLCGFISCHFVQRQERLKSELGLSETPPPVEPLTTSKLKAAPLPLSANADAQTDMRQVLDYYHETLKKSPEALAYSRKKRSSHPELIARFRLGFANRTFGLSTA